MKGMQVSDHEQRAKLKLALKTLEQKKNQQYNVTGLKY